MQVCNHVLNFTSVSWERNRGKGETIEVFPKDSSEDWGNDGSVNLTSAAAKLLETKIKNKICIHI